MLLLGRSGTESFDEIELFMSIRSTHIYNNGHEIRWAWFREAANPDVSQYDVYFSYYFQLWHWQLSHHEYTKEIKALIGKYIVNIHRYNLIE